MKLTLDQLKRVIRESLNEEEKKGKDSEYMLDQTIDNFVRTLEKAIGAKGKPEKLIKFLKGIDESNDNPVFKLIKSVIEKVNEGNKVSDSDIINEGMFDMIAGGVKILLNYKEELVNKGRAVLTKVNVEAAKTDKAPDEVILRAIDRSKSIPEEAKPVAKDILLTFKSILNKM